MASDIGRIGVNVGVGGIWFSGNTCSSVFGLDSGCDLSEKSSSNRKKGRGTLNGWPGASTIGTVAVTHSNGCSPNNLWAPLGDIRRRIDGAVGSPGSNGRGDTFEFEVVRHFIF